MSGATGHGRLLLTPGSDETRGGLGARLALVDGGEVVEVVEGTRGTRPLGLVGAVVPPGAVVAGGAGVVGGGEAPASARVPRGAGLAGGGIGLAHHGVHGAGVAGDGGVAARLAVIPRRTVLAEFHPCRAFFLGVRPGRAGGGLGDPSGAVVASGAGARAAEGVRGPARAVPTRRAIQAPVGRRIPKVRVIGSGRTWHILVVSGPRRAIVTPRTELAVGWLPC